MSIGLLRYQSDFTISDYPEIATINLAFPYSEFQLLVNDCFINEQKNPTHGGLKFVSTMIFQHINDVFT